MKRKRKYGVKNIEIIIKMIIDNFIFQGTRKYTE